MSKPKELIPKEKYINGESPAKIPNWRLIDSPDRPDCVESEEGIEIYTTKNNVKYVRTPEERFENLKDFPYEPHYALVEDLRMHYIDEGSKNGEVILLLHGQPTWSYLYRKVIPVLAKADYRVIAVDNMGMGRSDKPIDIGFHTFEHHVEILKKFIAAVNLENITLVGQDWGGVFGLRTVGDQPESFARVVAANTATMIMPKGMNPFLLPKPIKIDCYLKDFEIRDLFSERKRRKRVSQTNFIRFFQKWMMFCLTHPNFIASKFLQLMTLVDKPSTEELAAYDAPYPSLSYKAAIRTLPSMMAAMDVNNVEAWENLGKFEKPFLFLGGEKDLSRFGTPEAQKYFTDHIPGTKGQAHQRYPKVGHYIQEDLGAELAKKVISFIKANPM
jgi:haloalkane dehalogenase